ncbi:unnamed protein product [Urochloa decumbens]|uniref:Uncharacterized protein n=1 Tax=Urochloa decumbens TaxID=240449 RepID=A0ABC9BE13_9POAL
MGSAQLLKEVMHYRPLVAGWAHGYSSEVFARFGGGKILCADAGGHAAVYDADEQSFVPIPAMNSPKGAATSPSASSPPAPPVPPSLPASASDLATPTNASCFEELAYGGPREGWRWRPLPPPPFLQQDPYYDVACAATPAYAVVGCAATARVFVSTAAATAVAAAGDGAPPPAAQHVGLDLDPPPPEPMLGEEDPEWLLEDQALVSLGSGRLCVARFFNHYYDRYTPALAVFTGVEVVPSGTDDGSLSLIMHKSQCISTDGATCAFSEPERLYPSWQELARVSVLLLEY